MELQGLGSGVLGYRWLGFPAIKAVWKTESDLRLGLYKVATLRNPTEAANGSCVIVATGASAVSAAFSTPLLFCSGCAGNYTCNDDRTMTLNPKA